MIKFTAEQLVEIAKMAVESIGIAVGNFGWHINEDIIKNGDIRFDCECGGVITLKDMLKWDLLRVQVEKRYGTELSLYIGHRGEYEDAYNVFVIEPTENIREREEESKKKAEECKKRALIKKLDRMLGRKIESDATLGDIDALAALRAKLEAND